MKAENDVRFIKPESVLSEGVLSGGVLRPTETLEGGSVVEFSVEPKLAPAAPEGTVREGVIADLNTVNTLNVSAQIAPVSASTSVLPPPPVYKETHEITGGSISYDNKVLVSNSVNDVKILTPVKQPEVVTINETVKEPDFNCVSNSSRSFISDADFKKETKQLTKVNLINFMNKHRKEGINMYLPNSGYSVFISSDIKAVNKLSFLYSLLLESRNLDTNKYEYAKRYEVLRIIYTSLVFNLDVQPSFEEFTKCTNTRDMNILMLGIALMLSKPNADDIKLAPIYEAKCKNPKCANNKKMELKTPYQMDIYKKLKELYPIEAYAFNSLDSLSRVENLEKATAEKFKPKTAEFSKDGVTYKIGMSDISVFKLNEVSTFRSKIVKLLVNKIIEANLDPSLLTDYIPANFDTKGIALEEIFKTLKNVCELASFQESELEKKYSEAYNKYQELGIDSNFNMSNLETLNIVKNYKVFELINYFLTEKNTMSANIISLFLVLDILKITYEDMVNEDGTKVSIIVRNCADIYETINDLDVEVVDLITHHVKDFLSTLPPEEFITIPFKELVDNGCLSLDESLVIDAEAKVKTLQDARETALTNLDLSEEERTSMLDTINMDIAKAEVYKEEVDQLMSVLKSGKCTCGEENYVTEGLDVDFFSIMKILGLVD